MVGASFFSSTVLRKAKAVGMAGRAIGRVRARLWFTPSRPGGADHLHPYASAIDGFGYREPELGIEQDVDYLGLASHAEDGEKGWIKPLQELSMATNMLGVCLFSSITLAVKPSTWAGLLSAAVGRTVTKENSCGRPSG